jgi:hypothetical protein
VYVSCGASIGDELIGMKDELRGILTHVTFCKNLERLVMAFDDLPRKSSSLSISQSHCLFLLYQIQTRDSTNS